MLNKHTIPINALILSCICGIMFFMFSLVNDGEIFTFLVSVSSLSGFIAWFGISYSHYKFRKYHLTKQEINKLQYKAGLFPFAPIFCMSAIGIIVFAQFITLKSNYSVFDFVLLYSSIILFVLLYFGHIVYMRIKARKK